MATKKTKPQYASAEVVQDLVTAVTKLNTANSNLATRQALVEEDVRDRRQAVETLERESSKLRSRLDVFENGARMRVMAREAQRRETAQVRLMLETVKRDVTNLREAVAATHTRLNDLADREVTRQNALQSVEGQVARCRGLLNTQKQDVVDLQEVLATFRRDFTNLREAVDEIRKCVSFLTDDYHRRQRRAEEWKDRGKFLGYLVTGTLALWGLACLFAHLF